RVLPKIAPMPAVRAMANAPQNVTRTVALRIFAPPALAPIAPNRARNAREAADTTGTSNLAGQIRTVRRGNKAPRVNIAADVKAATTGRAEVISEMPSSSLA